jgi:hypothetical protein
MSRKVITKVTTRQTGGEKGSVKDDGNYDHAKPQCRTADCMMLDGQLQSIARSECCADRTTQLAAQMFSFFFLWHGAATFTVRLSAVCTLQEISSV